MIMCCVFLQDGNTPLHNASRNNRVAAVEMLVKNGAAMLVKNGAAINHTNKVSYHDID